MPAHANVEPERIVVDVEPSDNAAVRAEAVVDTGMCESPFDACHTPPALMLVGSDIGLKIGAMLPSSATNGGLTTTVLSLMTHSPVLDQRTNAGTRRERCAQAPGDAVRLSELVRVPADHTACHPRELDVL